jgi:hypothetical protein
MLLLLSAGIRVWHIRHTEVTARDGVGFIRYAWQLQHEPWTTVLRGNPHPPLYPLAILGVSIPLRQLVNDDASRAMQLSAQVASALAGVLLVIPMYYLGKELFNRSVGFWSAAIFQCLPASSRVLSDALAEGLWLLLAAFALLVALRAFRDRSVIGFAFCGALSGLAYLARPEGLLLAAATGLVLFGVQLVPHWRRSWSSTIKCAAVLSLVTLAIASPYALVIGHVTNKTTGIEILQTTSASAVSSQQVSCSLPPCGGGLGLGWGVTPNSYGAKAGGPLMRSVIGVFWFDAKKSAQWRRIFWSLKSLAGEIIKGCGYFAWLAVLIGLYWCRRPFSEEPGAWVIFALCALNTLVLWRVAYVAGYVAERHALPMVMCGLFWAVAATFAIGSWLPAALSRVHDWLRLQHISRPAQLLLALAQSAWLPVVLLLTQVGVALPRNLEPLHANRAGFHAAGLWLANHSEPHDVIVDPFAWVEYYAGHALQEPRPQEAGAGVPRRQFVVLGGSGNEHARLPLMPTAESLASRGTLVYRWPTASTQRKAEEVLVYCVNPEQ